MIIVMGLAAIAGYLVSIHLTLVLQLVICGIICLWVAASEGLQFALYLGLFFTFLSGLFVGDIVWAFAHSDVSLSVFHSILSFFAP